MLPKAQRISVGSNAQAAQKAQRAQSEFVRQESEALAEKMPEWKDPEKRPTLDALRETIRKAGKRRKITLAEFRLLTGACAEGCRQALRRAGLDGKPMTAFDIRDKVSREWGDKLLRILDWHEGSDREEEG